MKQIATGKLTAVGAKYGEHAPMATLCCNACRTCVTTNVLTMGLAALAGAAAYGKRVFRRASA